MVGRLARRELTQKESWRLNWDGLQGGFCGKYPEYLQENQDGRPLKRCDNDARWINPLLLELNQTLQLPDRAPIAEPEIKPEVAVNDGGCQRNLQASRKSG